MTVSKQAIMKILDKEFQDACSKYEIGEVSEDSAVITCELDKDRMLAQEGIASQGCLMRAAEFALKVAILGQIGHTRTLTMTSISINFLHKPKKNAEIIGECKLLRSKKPYLMGDVLLYSTGQKEPVAHAVGMYAMNSVNKQKNAQVK